MSSDFYAENHPGVANLVREKKEEEAHAATTTRVAAASISSI
jgi:hypothetical protein